MRTILLISVLALFSCQKKSNNVCNCHREIWKIQSNMEWQMIFKDSINTYLDFCENDGLVQFDIDNTKEVIICK